MNIKRIKYIPSAILFTAILYLSFSGLACSNEKRPSNVENKNSDRIYQSKKVLE